MTSHLLAALVADIIGAIPSPGSTGFNIGPLRIRYYSLSIIVGFIAGVVLIARRMPNRRFASEVASELAVPAILGGFIGSRLYHVVTDSNWADWYKVWEGGLGIPGGILGGTIAVAFMARRRGYPWTPLFDIIAPGLSLGQAIGRWANWFNQELYGGPLEGLLGLEIDPENRVAGFQDTETFHPTFLYESVWSFGLVGLMLWIDRLKILKPGRLFFVYMGGYAIGRLWIETIRIDNATEIFGLRINLWTMGFVLLVSVLALAFTGFRSKGEVDPWRVDEASADTAKRAASGDADEHDDDDDAADEYDDDGDEAGDGDSDDKDDDAKAGSDAADKAVKKAGSAASSKAPRKRK